MLFPWQKQLEKKKKNKKKTTNFDVSVFPPKSERVFFEKKMDVASYKYATCLLNHLYELIKNTKLISY